MHLEELQCGLLRSVTCYSHETPSLIPSRILQRCFAHVKEEGWWVVLGDPEADELYAMKRVSFGVQSSFTLTFQCPNPDLQEAVLYLVCDSYLGMDQQITVPMPGGAAPSQVCTHHLELFQLFCLCK